MLIDSEPRPKLMPARTGAMSATLLRRSPATTSA
jgi:hypothetical protein